MTTNIHSLIKTSMVTAIYIILTLLVAPLAFGPVQFRISEILNFIGLYNQRYVYAITLGVFLSNFLYYGPVDMIVGSLATFLALQCARWLGHYFTRNMSQTNALIVKYSILIICFAISMGSIAWMLLYVGAESAFWPVYASLALSETVTLLIGAPIMYLITQRIDFNV